MSAHDLRIDGEFPAQRGGRAEGEQHDQQPVKNTETKKKPAATPAAKSTIQEITPEMAEFYLTFNADHQRPLRKGHVACLAREMKEGRWKFNGDAIRIDSEGRLIDGQHRLRAVLQSGVTIRCVVIENLEPDSFYTIDLGGATRSTGDIFAMTGELNGKRLAAALTLCWRYENNLLNSKYKPSTQELVALLEKYPHMREAVKRTYAGPLRGALLKNAVGALLWFYVGSFHEDAVGVWWESLQTGAGIEAGTGLLALRSRLLRQGGTAGNLRTDIMLALTIKAWNADFAGKRVQQLVFRPDEAYPKFKS